MINGQVDGSQSYLPPLDVHRPIELLFFPFSFRLKQTVTRSSRQTWCFFFLGGTSGVRVPVKQRKIEVRTYAKLCGFAYLKKNNKTGEKTSVAIGVDLGRL